MHNLKLEFENVQNSENMHVRKKITRVKSAPLTIRPNFFGCLNFLFSEIFNFQQKVQFYGFSSLNRPDIEIVLYFDKPFLRQLIVYSHGTRYVIGSLGCRRTDKNLSYSKLNFIYSRFDIKCISNITPLSSII